MIDNPECRQAGIDETMTLMRNAAQITADRPETPYKRTQCAKSLLTEKRLGSSVKSSSAAAKGGAVVTSGIDVAQPPLSLRRRWWSAAPDRATRGIGAR